MSTYTRGASPKGGASRTSGTNGKGKTAKFRGLTLLLPKECPGEVLFAADDDNISDVLRVLVGEKQYLEIRQKVVEDKLSFNQTRTQLLELCSSILTETYGITAGE